MTPPAPRQITAASVTISALMTASAATSIAMAHPPAWCAVLSWTCMGLTVALLRIVDRTRRIVDRTKR